MNDYENVMRSIYADIASWGDFWPKELVDYSVLCKVILDKKWDEKLAMSVFCKVAPRATFDPGRKIPIVHEIMEKVRKNPEYQIIKKSENAR